MQNRGRNYVLSTTANNPIGRTDPAGLTWSSNLYFLVQWFNGAGETYRNYDGSSQETAEMANSPAVNRLREEFIDGGCKDIYSSGYRTFDAYFETAANPRTSDLSSTAFQVGGFDGASVRNNGNGTATYTIRNDAGTHSFFLHLPPDRKSEEGFMRTIHQKFEWTEKNACK